MKFCPACDMALYSTEEESVDGIKNAYLSCRKCDYKEPVTRDNPMIYEHVLREDKSVRLVMNTNMKNDPTLDHLDNIVCPNTACPSNAGLAKPDIVPVELNEKHLIWCYQCTNCDKTWTQTAGAKTD